MENSFVYGDEILEMTLQKEKECSNLIKEKLGRQGDEDPIFWKILQ